MKLGAMGILVKDIKLMTEFYRDVLHMKQNIEMEGFSGFETENGFYFNLCQRSIIESITDKKLTYPSGINGSMQLSFNVKSYEDVDKEYLRLLNAGAKAISAPKSKPYGLREAYVADPEGNLIEIVASK